MSEILKGDVVSSMGNLMTVKSITPKGDIITNWFDGEIITEGSFIKAELEMKSNEKQSSEFKIGDCVHLRSGGKNLCIIDTPEEDNGSLLKCRLWVDKKTSTVLLYREQVTKQETSINKYKPAPGAFGR